MTVQTITHFFHRSKGNSYKTIIPKSKVNYGFTPYHDHHSDNESYPSVQEQLASFQFFGNIFNS